MSYEINSWTIIDKYVNGKITNYFSYPTSFWPEWNLPNWCWIVVNSIAQLIIYAKYFNKHYKVNYDVIDVCRDVYSGWLVRPK